VAYLRRDARLPVASLASATGAARATVKARIDRLVRTGIIRGFTVELDAKSRDAMVRALVQIEIKGPVAERAIQMLLRIPEVRTAHSTNGRWDVIAEVEAPTLSAFDIVLRTIRQVDGVNLTESSILLSTFVAPPL
jgi:DNA-binding Lrp family transcriptional regulator